VAAQEAERARKEQEKSVIVSYRVSLLEYQTMTRIADLLFKNGSIKANIVTALAKAAAFTQINLFLQIEARENAYKEREEALQDHKLPMRGFDYVPPSGS
jgi:hypothetical protein